MGKDLLKKISILSASLIIVSGGCIAANIPEIARTFPEVPLYVVENLTTIPALFIIISVLMSNKIASYIGHKATIIIGLIIVLISGIVPIISNSFALIFISRATFGIGVGLFNSLLVGMISYFYDGYERAQLIGFQSAFEGIGGMVLTFVVGQLLKISWQTSFWVYIIAVPVIIMLIIFVPNIPREGINKEKNKKELLGEKEDSNIVSKLAIVGYILLLFIVVNFYMSVSVKVTTLMTTFGYGDATDGSNILSLIGLGAMMAGFMFGNVFKITRKYTLPIAFLVMSVAMFMIGLSNSVLLTGVSAVICGFAFRTFIPYLFNKVNSASSSNAGFTTALLLVGFNLGSALSPYTMAIIENLLGNGSIRNIFYFEGAILLLFSFVGGVYVRTSGIKKESVELN